MRDVDKKLLHLRAILQETGGCAVAYSGGVDSALLTAVAFEVLGSRCLAVLADSALRRRRETKTAVDYLVAAQIPHRVVVSQALSLEAVYHNTPDRCLACKRHVLQLVREAGHGLPHVAEGSNADDRLAHRPGRQAVQEQGVLSPLELAGLAKPEIRELAREVYHLPMAEAPANSCLATRLEPGTRLTADALSLVEALEDFFLDLGLQQVRARPRDRTLWLAIGPAERRRVEAPGVLSRIKDRIQAEGFLRIEITADDRDQTRTETFSETPCVENGPKG